jgi:hypothetical protein
VNVVVALQSLNTKRNPLMHPEMSLDPAEARHLFCMCESATCAVIKECLEKKLDLAKAFGELPDKIKTA